MNETAPIKRGEVAVMSTAARLDRRRPHPI